MPRDTQEVYDDLDDMEEQLTKMLVHPEVNGFAAEDYLTQAVVNIQSAKHDLPVPDGDDA